MVGRFHLYRRQAKINPNTAAAKGQAWRGIGSAATQVGNVAIKAEREMNRADAEDAMSEFNAYIDGALYDPKAGHFNSRKGDKAEGLTLELFGKDGMGNGSMHVVAMEYGKKLPAKSREYYDAAVRNRLDKVKHQTRAFEAGERRNYLQSVQKLTIEDSMNRVGRFYEQPYEVKAAIDQGVASLDSNPVGLDDASLKLAKQMFVNQAHGTVIDQYLSVMRGGDAAQAGAAQAAARAWFDANKGQIPGRMHAAYEKKLRNAKEYHERRAIEEIELKEQKIEEEEKRIKDTTARELWGDFGRGRLQLSDVLYRQGHLETSEYKALVKAAKKEGPVKTQPHVFLDLLDQQDDAWTEDDHNAVYKEARSAFLRGDLSQTDFGRFRKDNVTTPQQEAAKDASRQITDQEKAQKRLVKETRSMHRKSLRTSISLSSPFMPKTPQDAESEAESMLMFDQLTQGIEDPAEIERIGQQVQKSHKLKFFKSGHLALLEPTDKRVISRVGQLQRDLELLAAALESNEIGADIFNLRARPLLRELDELGAGQ